MTAKKFKEMLITKKISSSEELNELFDCLCVKEKHRELFNVEEGSEIKFVVYNLETKLYYIKRTTKYRSSLKIEFILMGINVYSFNESELVELLYKENQQIIDIVLLKGKVKSF
jgi:hypothetical protein